MGIIPIKSYLGLDISDLSLRIIQLKRKYKKISLSSFNEIRLEEGIIKDGKIIDQDRVVESLNILLKKPQGEKINTNMVVACLPEQKSFIKLIQFSTSSQNIDQALEKEIVKHFPYSIDEIYYDKQIIDIQNNQRYSVLVSACPKKIVDSYLSVLEKAELDPTALEVESQTLARSLISEKSSLSDVFLIIDIGLNRSTFTIANKSIIYSSFSSDKINGNSLTAAIVEELGISIKKAEEIKKSTGFKLREIKKSKDIFMNMIFEVINTNLDYFQENYSYLSIKKIILSGGGAYVKELPKLIENQIKIKTKLGNHWINIPDLPVKDNLSYSTVIGLALRDYLLDI